MAYYTGTATSYSDLLTQFKAALALEGWTMGSGGYINKGSVNISLTSSSLGVFLRGASDVYPGTANLSPTSVRLGHYDSAVAVTFPVFYEAFIHTAPDEVYLVVNHTSTRYMWLAFGKSTLPQSGTGTGTWVGATSHAYTNNSGINLTSTSGGGSYGSTNTFDSVSLFTTTNKYINSFVDHGFTDMQASNWGAASVSGVGLEGNTTCAWRLMGPIVKTQPNSWNGESVLIPIQAYTARPENKNSMTVDVQHARYCRIDNYEPGDIISLGSDKWKVYPWWRKNVSVRDGQAGAEHTGTWGWAIRYDGV